ncbi:protein PIGMENT DEFECTIVE 338, chloroplastic-like [Mangifera indica]|uniref:protein PIGMENT DEFECTIVE 338, chloroplastic-like n=1 Tax=Mangifera indica TaxID=29780 RepID=UPI001CFAF3FD|nr:protein PIGMENT DEFECTIVE 338, chloroplastic-like [Mangifera indica]
MQTLQHCKSLTFLHNFSFLHCNEVKKKPSLKVHSFSTLWSSKTLLFKSSFGVLGSALIGFCSQNDGFDGFSSTQLSGKIESDGNFESDELELLNKPSHVAVDDNGLFSEVEKEVEKPDKEEAIKPFLKFLKPREPVEDVEDKGSELGVDTENVIVDDNVDGDKKINVEYYEPKRGDFVVGVVVSGNENRLDVNVGADLLGTMLTKEVLPLYEKEMDFLLCDLEKDADEFMVRGKMGIVKNDDAMSGGSGPGRPVVETGTVLLAEVLGRTLSGRPLLSTRRFFRKLAWHRVRQIKQLNEPIEVKITEWNTGGLLTRIEGLRAFLPKVELLNRVNSFTELKENVGRRINVLITRINEDTNDLILSEREAWALIHLKEGTLLDGTVKKIFPYGAQIRIGDTNRSGLLHVSNMSRTRVTSVSDLLKEDEKVKVLVVKSLFPDKIALSIADLESEPGLFVSNKERVFSEAEEMAKKYRQKLPAVSASPHSEPLPTDTIPFDNEASLCANWKWFKFENEKMNQINP